MQLSYFEWIALYKEHTENEIRRTPYVVLKKITQAYPLRSFAVSLHFLEKWIIQGCDRQYVLCNLQPFTAVLSDITPCCQQGTRLQEVEGEKSASILRSKAKTHFYTN